MRAWRPCSPGASRRAPAPGPGEAEKAARNDCPSEPFTLIGTEEVRKSPQCVEYRYETRRGIVFTVTSQIATGGLFGCYASVTSDYAARVQDLYRSRCEDAISRSCRYDADRGCVSVSSFDELQDVARGAMAANDIYAGERDVNTASWCEDHPVIVFWVQWRDGADAEAVTVGKADGYEITGGLSEQKLLDALQQGYAQAVADGKIPDRGELPEDLAASVHASQLTELVVRGHAIPFDLGADDGATSDDETRNPYQRLYDGGRSAPMRWNKTTGAYEITLDLGEGEGYYDGSAGWHESYEPGSWLIEHVMDAAGGTYRVEGDAVVWQPGARSGRIAMRWSAQRMAPHPPGNSMAGLSPSMRRRSRTTPWGTLSRPSPSRRSPSTSASNSTCRRGTAARHSRERRRSVVPVRAIPPNPKFSYENAPVLAAGVLDVHRRRARERRLLTKNRLSAQGLAGMAGSQRSHPPLSCGFVAAKRSYNG